MPGITEQEAKAMHEAFDAFKEAHTALEKEVKATGSASGELKAKLDTLSGKLDTVEASINKRLAKEDLDSTKSELLEKIKDLEAKVNRKGGVLPGDDAKKEENRQKKEAFIKALRYTGGGDVKEFLGPELAKSLTVSSDTAGGYAAPPEFVAEMLADIVEFSPIRSVATTRTTSRGEVLFPKRTQTAAASWTAEVGTRSETQNPAFGMERIPVHEMYAMTKVSKQDLEDFEFDLEAFLRAEFAEQMGLTEGTALVSGNGVGKPEGFLSHADIGIVNSGIAAEITADGLIALYYEPKEVYINSGTFALSRSTMKTIRQLKDGTGQYLWAAGIKSDAKPATILDRPYIICPDMPSIGADNYPVAFGDFRRAMRVIDRVNMEVMVDPFTSKSTGMYEISARRRVGGQVVLPEALKKLKIAA